MAEGPPCGLCSAPAPDGAAFCPSCGSRLEAGRAAREAFAETEGLIARAAASPTRPLFVLHGYGTADTLTEIRGHLLPFRLASPVFASDPGSPFANYAKTHVLVLRGPQRQVGPLVPPLEAVAKANVPLAILAEDFAGDALATLAVNRERKTVSVLGLVPTRPATAAQDLDRVARLAGTVVQEVPPNRLDAFGRVDGIWSTARETFVVQAGGPDTAHELAIGGRTVRESGLKYRMALERIARPARATSTS